jgi:hypothetical protein
MSGRRRLHAHESLLNTPAEAEYYLNLGVKHFCLGADVTTVFNWCKEHGTRLRDMLKSA